MLRWGLVAALLASCDGDAGGRRDGGSPEADAEPGCPGVPVALPSGALAVETVDVGERCGAMLVNDGPLSIAVRASAGRRLHLDGEPLEPSPARATIAPGRHTLTADDDDSARVDVRPGSDTIGCDGRLVVHGDRAEELDYAVALTVAEDCPIAVEADTPVTLRASAAARIDVAVRDGTGEQEQPFRLDAGLHRIELWTSDPLADGVTPVRVRITVQAAE